MGLQRPRPRILPRRSDSVNDEPRKPQQCLVMIQGAVGQQGNKKAMWWIRLAMTTPCSTATCGSLTQTVKEEGDIGIEGNVEHNKKMILQYLQCQTRKLPESTPSGGLSVTHGHQPFRGPSRLRENTKGKRDILITCATIRSRLGVDTVSEPR